MYARVIWIPLRAGSLSDAMAYFRQAIWPTLMQQTGFVEGHFLSNETSQQCLILTRWLSEVHRQGAESSNCLQNVFQQMEPHFAGQPIVTHYELGAAQG